LETRDRDLELPFAEGQGAGGEVTLAAIQPSFAPSSAAVTWLAICLPSNFTASSAPPRPVSLELCVGCVLVAARLWPVIEFSMLRKQVVPARRCRLCSKMVNAETRMGTISLQTGTTLELFVWGHRRTDEVLDLFLGRVGGEREAVDFLSHLVPKILEANLRSRDVCEARTGRCPRRVRWLDAGSHGGQGE
jgi:hypothetical protein